MNSASQTLLAAVQLEHHRLQSFCGNSVGVLSQASHRRNLQDNSQTCKAKAKANF